MAIDPRLYGAAPPRIYSQDVSMAPPRSQNPYNPPSAPRSAATGAASGALAGMVGGPVGMAIGAGIGAVGSVFGSKKQAEASKRAGDIQSQSDDQAFELERQRDEEERRRWEAEQDFQRRQFEASEEERLYTRSLRDAREARMAPYREAGAAAIGRLSGLLSPQGQMGWRSPSRAGHGGVMRDLVQR